MFPTKLPRAALPSLPGLPRSGSAIPFREASAALRRLQAVRPTSHGKVVLGYSSESNLGTPMGRIITAAGITAFGRPFLNLRSTRSK